MSTFILLHGAWHASWCWKYVTPMITQHNHHVIAPDLPGHGENIGLSFTKITLSTYVDEISNLIHTLSEPVILVGHSLSGIIISQIAENIPDKVKQLIYVAGYLPPDKGSLITEAKQSISRGVSSEIQIDVKKCEIAINQSSQVKNIFYNQCSIEDANYALSKLKKEPLLPFSNTVNLSETNFGRVKKLYIECMKDKAIAPEDQRRMYTAANCKSVSLEEADHSPFFSTPDLLTQLLLKTVL